MTLRPGPDLRLVPFLDLARVTADVREEVLAGGQRCSTTRGSSAAKPCTPSKTGSPRYCGTEHAVGVANGTDALHLTLRALGIGPGDEVVVPANTFVATVEAVVLAGARRGSPTSTRTHCCSPRRPSRRSSRRRPAPSSPCTSTARCRTWTRSSRAPSSSGILLVEDAAQAQGATWAGRTAGSFGVAGCFSFYPGKNLGAFGDAGAVVTHDADAGRDGEVDAGPRSLRGGHHEHGVLGTNSRLDTLQAVVLDAKLPRLDGWNRARAISWRSYRRLHRPEVAAPGRGAAGRRGVHHLAVVRVRDRDRVRRELAERGVGTGIHYPTPCHLMAPYATYADASLPVAEAAAEEVISLPMYPHMRAAGRGRCRRAGQRGRRTRGPAMSTTSERLAAAGSGPTADDRRAARLPSGRAAVPPLVLGRGATAAQRHRAVRRQSRIGDRFRPATTSSSARSARSATTCRSGATRSSTTAAGSATA